MNENRKYRNGSRIEVGSSLLLSLEYNGVVDTRASQRIAIILSKCARELDSLLMEEAKDA